MIKVDRCFGRFRGWIPSPLLPRRADLPSGAFSLIPLRPDVSQRRAGRPQFRAGPCLYTWAWAFPGTSSAQSVQLSDSSCR